MFENSIIKMGVGEECLLNDFKTWMKSTLWCNMHLNGGRLPACEHLLWPRMRRVHVAPADTSLTPVARKEQGRLEPRLSSQVNLLLENMDGHLLLGHGRFSFQQTTLSSTAVYQVQVVRPHWWHFTLICFSNQRVRLWAFTGENGNQVWKLSLPPLYPRDSLFQSERGVEGGSGLQDHLSLRWRQTRSPWWRPRATGRRRSACVVVRSARPTRRVRLPVTPRRHRKCHNLPIPGKPTGKGQWGQSPEGFF